VTSDRAIPIKLAARKAQAEKLRQLRRILGGWFFTVYGSWLGFALGTRGSTSAEA
jgi:hypothetical protein